MNEEELMTEFHAIREQVKFKGEDKSYLEARAVFANKIGSPNLYQYMDQFGLYAGPQTLASRLFSYDILKETLDVPGHIAEFGVWHGSNLLFLTKVLRLLRPNTTKQVFGFDNFSGLPCPHPLDGEQAMSTSGAYRGNEEVLREAIRTFCLDDWVHLIKGDANETIPQFERHFPEALISLAWIDFDLYEPCRTALQFLAKRLSSGGMIVFDEAVSAAWPGETIALREFLEDNAKAHFRMRANPIGRQPVMYMIKD